MRPFDAAMQTTTLACNERAMADSERAFRACLKALTFGNEKHGPGNWTQKQDATLYFIRKLQGHIFAYLAAPTAPDVDSGLHHLAHVLANATLLYETARLRGEIVQGEEGST